MPSRRFYGRAWKTWVATFLVLKGAPLLSNDEERQTFSSHLRRWLGINPKRKYAMAGSGAFLSFLAWLAVHIVFDTLSYTPGKKR